MSNTKVALVAAIAAITSMNGKVDAIGTSVTEIKGDLGEQKTTIEELREAVAGDPELEAIANTLLENANALDGKLDNLATAAKEAAEVVPEAPAEEPEPPVDPAPPVEE